MKKLIFIGLLFFPLKAYSDFKEFFVDNNSGSNINAGDDKTVVTAAGGWNSTLSSFTATTGTPFSGSVAGDFASLYLTGASTTSFVARIISVEAGGARLILDTTAKAGTAPATAASGYSCTVGGKWYGPNNDIQFPVNFFTGALTNTSGDSPRLNLKSGSTYYVNSAISDGMPGPKRFQGYTNTPGDGGKFILGTGAAVGLITIAPAAVNTTVSDGIFYSSATTGSSVLFLWQGTEGILLRSIFKQARSACLSLAGSNMYAGELEMYGCNKNNSTSSGGIATSAQGVTLSRIFVHDIPESNSSGIRTTGSTIIKDSIFVGAGLYGINDSSQFGSIILNTLVAYNGSDGLALNSFNIASHYIENCLFIGNGGYGINGITSPSIRNGSIFNSGFYSNTSGNYSTTLGVDMVGPINFTENPLVDPTNGNFNVKSPFAIGAGRGTFESYGYGNAANFYSYPNLGPIQQKTSPGGAVSIRN